MVQIMKFQLPDLPFAMDALEPHMSAETLKLHHGKHHKAYVDKLNKAIEGTPYAKMSLDEIIRSSFKKDPGVFNNAGQHWNHTIFWQAMSPNGGGIPGKLESKITADFGSVQAFKDAFKTAATTQFGSGWAWLVQGSDGKLKCTKTPNGSNPLATGEGKALLGCDVWEHSYYLDFRTRRPDYVTNWLDKLANYEYAAAQL